LESPDLSDTVNEELTRRAQAVNPVTLMRLENQAVATLLQIHTRKNREAPPPVSDSHG
jgi:hypothetical protein